MSGPRSFSRIPFRLYLSSGVVVEGELIRHLAPFTVGVILKRRRVGGLVTKEKDMLVLVSGLTAGLEKSQHSFKRGAVAFLPLDGSIRFVTVDTDAQRPMNHIGEVLNGVDRLESAKSGETAELEVLV